MKEMQRPFFSVNAAELVSGMSGQSEAKIRKLFASAKVSLPALALTLPPQPLSLPCLFANRRKPLLSSSSMRLTLSLLEGYVIFLKTLPPSMLTKKKTGNYPKRDVSADCGSVYGQSRRLGHGREQARGTIRVRSSHWGDEPSRFNRSEPEVRPVSRTSFTIHLLVGAH